jgi:hypothetical protein
MRLSSQQKLQVDAYFQDILIIHFIFSAAKMEYYMHFHYNIHPNNLHTPYTQLALTMEASAR